MFWWVIETNYWPTNQACTQLLDLFNGSSSSQYSLFEWYHSTVLYDWVVSWPPIQYIIWLWCIIAWLCLGVGIGSFYIQNHHKTIIHTIRSIIIGLKLRLILNNLPYSLIDVGIPRHLLNILLCYLIMTIRIFHFSWYNMSLVDPLWYVF